MTEDHNSDNKPISGFSDAELLSMIDFLMEEISSKEKNVDRLRFEISTDYENVNLLLTNLERGYYLASDCI